MVHDLRREAEGRAWAIRAVRGETHLREPLSPAGAVDGSADTAAHAAASDAAYDATCDPLVALLTQLRAATTRYVLELRAEGARPEQMLVQVKAFVREAMSVDRWTDPEATRALTEEVVRWSIAAYYDG